ncbi:hypothetical protein WR30_23655 [Burkholderia contaminans FFH2055]|uniref:hypothetical protein n=1 Tax=Burkholderia contaminans TaxID=488447 RepID=UPI000625ACCB|nr:hypothetical protein [Burkholderia contaminans]KKL33572.1 hypothetical protein WR30_23655 [Burkholderia contaminans FFH2055]MEB4636171.1 hypothetical protein [Burkholderia contaminans]MEB4650608.1 hypothetical protein [Burkholderia contaminans]MEB4660220.1 hypothetical protein [Burkholderia contaminans]MEB4665887.1 hypothetical protein [Burkholderia contaminans]
MSSHIPSHRTATEAARTDDARGPDGATPDAARDAVQLDGDVVLSLLALIGGGAELKDAAGGGQGQGRPADTAPAPAREDVPWPRTAPGALGVPGIHGGATGPVAPGTGPALNGSAQAGGNAVSGIVPDEGDDTAQRQERDLAAPEGALPLPSAPQGDLSPRSGAGNAEASAADTQPALHTAGRDDVGPHADGAVGETARVLAGTPVFAGPAGPLATPPRAGAGAVAQNEPFTPARGHALPDTEPRASTLPVTTTATTQMPAARRGEAAPTARSAHDVIADAAGTAGRYASATMRRAGTLAAATGRSLAAHGAALPGVRALEANLVERGWLARRTRPSVPSDEAGIGTGAGADAGDPSSVASGNEAAGVVNVVRFVVQAREWLDERRPRTPVGGCPHRRSLRCRWQCRAGCTRRGP